MPAFDAVIGAMDRMNGRREGVLAALAVHRYRLANGDWPTDMIEVAPDHIIELPVDIMNGNSLLLEIDSQGPVIYSVGRDLDDDGGIQTADERGALIPSAQWAGGSYHTECNGDWIVWPQARFNEQGIPEEKQ